jgi:hypothetical protein
MQRPLRYAETAFAPDFFEAASAPNLFAATRRPIRNSKFAQI